MLLALVLDPGLTSTSSLRESVRVYIQVPTYEWIKVKRKIDTTRYLVLSHIKDRDLDKFILIEPLMMITKRIMNCHVD